MKIGGGGRKPYITPSNSGMRERASAQLRHLAHSHNVRQTTAISIDAPECIIWNKGDGSIKCTCTYNNLITKPEISSNLTSTPSYGGSSGYQISDPEDATGQAMPSPRPPEHDPLPDADEDLDFGVDGDDLNAGINDYSDLDDSDGALAELNALAPTRYGDTVKCPVCVGASLVNAWQPLRGQRIVLEFSSPEKVDHSATAEIEVGTRPDLIELGKGEYVEWTTKLPAAFNRMMRLQVWHNDNAVVPVTLSMYRPNTPNTVYPCTVKDLNALANNGLLGGEWKIRATAVKAIYITHVEFIFLMGDPSYVQMPQLDVPYDHDYYDYNLNVNLEFAADVNIKEGDLIAENKYGRLWRASAVNRRALADGTGFGITVDARVVQPKEVYYNLNPYLKEDLNYKLFLSPDSTTEFVRTR